MAGLQGFDGVPGERGDVGPAGEIIAGPIGNKGYPGIMGDHGPTGMVNILIVSIYYFLSSNF